MIPRHARSRLVHCEGKPTWPGRPFPAAPCARLNFISSLGHKDHMAQFALSNHRVKSARLPSAPAEGFSYSRRCFIFFQQMRGCSQWDNRELMKGKKCQDICNKMDCCDILRRFPNLNDVGAGVRLLKLRSSPLEMSFLRSPKLPPSSWRTGARSCIQTFRNPLDFFPKSDCTKSS